MSAAGEAAEAARDDAAASRERDVLAAQTKAAETAHAELTKLMVMIEKLGGAIDLELPQHITEKGCTLTTCAPAKPTPSKPPPRAHAKPAPPHRRLGEYLSLVEGRLHSLFNTAQRLTSRVPTPAPADAYGAAKEDPNDDQRATLATLLGWVRPRHLADKGENNKMMANVQRGGHHDLHFEEE